MKKLDIQKVFSFFGLILRCPICNEHYQLSGMEVLESEEDEFMAESKVLLHSTCKACKATVIFNIDISGPDVFSVGMITDLTAADSIKFKDLDPISVDDCIALHESLKGNKYNFVRSFSGKK
ncbi:MAG TPA: hypothetical protein VEA59_04655 [Patescibacteria group bacterium]|nr:hypothetical protein [Patescibacteria group bacterium]